MCGSTLSHLSLSPGPELAPQRDSAGCRGVDGPFPQPLSMKGIAYEVAADASTYTLAVPMTDRLVNRSLRAFSEDLASEAPVPGGGSAAAYAGAIGAALAAMVARISAKRNDHDTFSAFIDEVENLRRDFLRLVDDDSAAYARVAQAMKLPRSTAGQKRERADRLQAALLAASRVPLEVAKTSRRLLDACERALATASPATASDLGVGALMGEAALRGAAMNVMINLASLKDAAQVKVLSEDLDRVLEGSEEQRKRITDFVESRIAR